MLKIENLQAFSNPENIFLAARYNYLPTSVEASGAAWGIRKRVWKFKDGDFSITLDTARWVASVLDENITLLDDCVFACIPASSKDRNEARFCFFAAEVCRATGMTNGFNQIKVSGDRIALHEHRVCKSLETVQVLEFNRDFFNGRQVIIFDDVVTRGDSLATMIDAFQAMGATVVGAVFLARTSYSVPM